jgi:hypothetical protein
VQSMRENVYLGVCPRNQFTIHPDVFSGFHGLSLPDGRALVAGRGRYPL